RGIVRAYRCLTVAPVPVDADFESESLERCACLRRDASLRVDPAGYAPADQIQEREPGERTGAS
ncbi:MAG TPA: hypothetical protein VNM48_22115, partial [Chloroflexota bacterium]|nr:hypothetical protein [Chloroflexota bacterium]